MTPPYRRGDPLRHSLDRAFRRLQRFIRGAEAATTASPIVWNAVRNVERRSLDFTIMNLPPINPEWEHEVAEIAHAARVVLDHLTKELVAAQDGAPLNDKRIVRKLNFPISKDADSFRKREKEMSQYFRPQDWEVIRRLQLFNAGNVEVWGPQASDLFPALVPAGLHVLSDLDNEEKHQWRPPVWFGLGDPTGDVAEVGGKETAGSEIPGGVLEVGAVGYRIYFKDELPDGRPGDAEMDKLRQHLPAPWLSIATPEWSFEGWPIAVAIPDARALLAVCLQSAKAVLDCFLPVIDIREDPGPLPPYRAFGVPSA